MNRDIVFLFFLSEADAPRVSVRVWTLCCFHSFASIQNLWRPPTMDLYRSMAPTASVAGQPRRNRDCPVRGVYLVCAHRLSKHLLHHASPRRLCQWRTTSLLIMWTLLQNGIANRASSNVVPFISYISTLGLYTLLLSTVIRPGYLVH